MINENTNEDINCPFCHSSDDCEHCFAVMDLTFNECLGGYIFEKMEELVEQIESSILSKLATLLSSKVYSDYSLNELWQSVWQDYDLECMDIDLEYRILFELFEELFDHSDAIDLQGVSDGPPGQSSSYKVFYAENPKRCYSLVLKELNRRLCGDQASNTANSNDANHNDRKSEMALKKAFKFIEELEEDKRVREIRLQQMNAQMEKFKNPEHLRAYLDYADEFEEHGPYKTLTYEQWFKREFK